MYPLYLEKLIKVEQHIKHKATDFVVGEVPLYTPSGQGKHVWLFIRKIGINTTDVVNYISDKYKIKRKYISFAGRKDKKSVSIQWFSIYNPQNFKKFKAASFAVLSYRYSNFPIKLGELAKNVFTITVNNVEAREHFLENLKKTSKNGFINLFGLQRVNSKNLRKALETFREDTFSKREMFLFSVIQSEIFNRIAIRRPKKRVEGDILTVSGVPTAPLFGYDTRIPNNEIAKLEIGCLEEVVKEKRKFFKIAKKLNLKGQRRPLIAYPTIYAYRFLDKNRVRIIFSLPSGSYATVFLSQLLGYIN